MAAHGAICRAGVLIIFVCAVAVARAEPHTMTISIDASDLPRKLLHGRVTVPVKSGEVRFAYPKWMPGTHAPSGPVQNVGGLRFRSKNGKPLEWRRDAVEMWQFVCTVPDNVKDVVVEVDYICSQPDENSIGIDSFGNAAIGVINWNTCMLYPVAWKPADVMAALSLKLPAGWKYATALETADTQDGVVSFKGERLDELIDCPLICGEHLRTIALEQDFRPASLSLVSESESATNLKPKLVAQYARVVAEAGAIFKGAPYDSYKFLVTCSDDLPPNGLEHRRSSLDGVGERDLVEDDPILGWVGYLLPHEFVHAWCGKYRRPADMVTGDFHTPQRTELLWVYEGLTQYLGEVLCVRSGLWGLDHYKRLLANDISYLKSETGREWRPLEDTAVASALLRAHSAYWGGLRRSQDYYVEGKLLWLEIDATIRDATGGARSLDDFSAAFFAVKPDALPVSPYTLDELCAALNTVSPYDWKEFLQSRVGMVQENLPLDVVGKIGYRLQYATETPEFIKKREKERKYVATLDALGADIGEDGKLRSNIVPGSPIDAAELVPGSSIIGVNGQKFSADRMKDAIKDSVTRGTLELLVLNGDAYRTVTLDYRDGTKYLELVRDDAKPDLLAAICTGRIEEEE